LNIEGKGGKEEEVRRGFGEGVWREGVSLAGGDWNGFGWGRKKRRGEGGGGLSEVELP